MERFCRTLRAGCLDHLAGVTSLHDVQVRLDAFLDEHSCGWAPSNSAPTSSWMSLSSATKTDPRGVTNPDPIQVFSGWSWLSRGARLASSASGGSCRPG